MSQSPQLRVSRWDKHRLCSEHGARYLMLTDFDHPAQTGLCAHPTCLEKMVRATGSYPLCGGLVRFCLKLDADNCTNGDFVDFVVERLLVGAKNGKLTVMNPVFMRFTALNYLNNLRKDDRKRAAEQTIRDQINEILEKEAAYGLEDMSAGTMVTSSLQGFSYSNPEKAVSSRQIVQMTISEWGVETYLWLWGELSDLDYQKVTKKQHKELLEIKRSYKKWYLDRTNESF